MLSNNHSPSLSHKHTKTLHYPKIILHPIDTLYLTPTFHHLTLYYPMNMFCPKFTFYSIIIYYSFSYKYPNGLYYAIAILHPKHNYYPKYAFSNNHSPSLFL